MRRLPITAYLPGHGTRPRALASDAPASRDAVSSAPYVLATHWAENAEYLWGVDLYNAGFFWEAHEVWEAVWRAAASDAQQHAFLQALIQAAAACLKLEMGDLDAAGRLAERASRRLEQVRAERGAAYMGLDLDGFAAAIRCFVHDDPQAGARPPSIVLDALNPGEELPPVELPIDGVLDLHTFRAADVGALVGDYLDECRARGVLEVRIVHGKGKGTLRRTVHAVLARRADVTAYHLAPAERGGWGATIVALKHANA